MYHKTSALHWLLIILLTYPMTCRL